MVKCDLNNSSTPELSQAEAPSAGPFLRDILKDKIGSVVILHFTDPKYASFEGTLVEFDPSSGKGSLMNPTKAMRRRFRVGEIESIEDPKPNASSLPDQAAAEHSSGQKNGAAEVLVTPPTPQVRNEPLALFDESKVSPPPSQPISPDVLQELSAKLINPALASLARALISDLKDQAPIRFGNLEVENAQNQLENIRESLTPRQRGFELLSPAELLMLQAKEPVPGVLREKVKKDLRMKSSEIRELLTSERSTSRPMIFDNVTVWFKTGLRASGVMTCTPECNIATLFNHDVPFSLKFDPLEDINRIEINPPQNKKVTP